MYRKTEVRNLHWAHFYSQFLISYNASLKFHTLLVFPTQCWFKLKASGVSRPMFIIWVNRYHERVVRGDFKRYNICFESVVTGEA